MTYVLWCTFVKCVTHGSLLVLCMAQSAAPAERDFASTVRDIRADNGPLTWGLFEVSNPI